ncbi:MAG: radical SAM family heme chaperone HemW [Thermodesulfobacteriota bacterium]
MSAAGAKPFAFPRVDAPRKAPAGKSRRKPPPPEGPELLLYLHVPFCRRKCHYCAFASQVPESARDFEDYAQYVLREISHWKRALAGRSAATLFIGGGTPSLLPLPHLENILFSLRKAFPFREGVEISLEANPDSAADWEYLHGLAALGVNRLSLGVQSFDDHQLLRLGRPHSSRQAHAAFELIRRAGFANVSLDLMFGLPGQRLIHWLETLKQAAALRPEHLSCYALTLEPGTLLERQSRELDMGLPAEEDQAKMFLYGSEYLESQGYLHYEISNYARMGFACAHNLGYWEGRDYLGLGPSAVSTVGGRRWRNPSGLAEYARAVLGKTLAEEAEELDPRTRLRELVMLSLRTTKGLNLKEYAALAGSELASTHKALVQALRQKELIRLSGGHLRLTKAGMLVSNTILSHLLDRLP